MSHFRENVLIYLLLVYAAMSLICFVAYAWDKKRAENGRTRIPERRLHLFELLGGWPGALVAQQYFRHKNRKISYQVKYWAIVALHLGCLALFCYADLRWFN